MPVDDQLGLVSAEERLLLALLSVINKRSEYLFGLFVEEILRTFACYLLFVHCLYRIFRVVLGELCPELLRLYLGGFQSCYPVTGKQASFLHPA